MKSNLSLFTIIFLLFPNSVFAQDSNQTQNQDSISKDIYLKEVVIKAKHKYFKRKADKFILKFNGNPFFQGKSISEALDRSPMILNRNDSYLIVGKESTMIYINGRPTTMTGENLHSFLSSKQADDVDYIEIITNSSTKYDASNKAGIINIVMKKMMNDGIITTLGGQAGKGKEWKFGTNGMLAYKTGGLSLNLFANEMSSHKKRQSSTIYDLDDSNCEEDSYIHQKGSPVTAQISMNYAYSKSNDVGLSYTLENLNANYNELHSTISKNNFDELVKTSDWKYRSHEIQAYTDNKFGKTTMNLLYNLYYRKNNTPSNSIGILHKYNILEGDSDRYILQTAGLDLSTAADSSLTFSYGAKGTIFNTHTKYAFADIYNNFKYKEYTGALYLSGEKTFGKFDINVGLRFEITRQQLDNNRKTYRNFFPYAYFSYGEKTTYYINYARSIDRPPYMNLTLSPVYFSSSSWTIGNPELNPSITNNLELGLNTANLNFKMFGKYIENEIFEYSYNKDDSIITSFKNLKGESQIGTNIDWIFSPVSFAQLVLSPTLYYDYAKYDNNESTHSWNSYVDGKLVIKFDKKGIFDMDIDYWNLFPQKEDGVKWKNRANLSCTLNCNLIHNSLKLSLKAKDIFNQDIARYSNSYAGSTVNHNNNFDVRSLIFSLNYIFKNGKRVKKNKSISVDDINRIPTE